MLVASVFLGFMVGIAPGAICLILARRLLDLVEKQLADSRMLLEQVNLRLANLRGHMSSPESERQRFRDLCGVLGITPSVVAVPVSEVGAERARALLNGEPS